MIVPHYAALLVALRARVAELGITHQALDALAGLPDGYAGKLLCNPPMRRLSAVNLFNVLAALALRPVLEHDPELLARNQNRLVKRRQRRGVLSLPSIHMTPDAIRLNGSRGGTARAAKLDAAERSRIARVAAQARWSRLTAA
jgi:hypothetical protein